MFQSRLGKGPFLKYHATPRRIGYFWILRSGPNGPEDRMNATLVPALVSLKSHCLCSALWLLPLDQQAPRETGPGLGLRSRARLPFLEAALPA